MNSFFKKLKMNFLPHVRAFQNSTGRTYYVYLSDIEEFIETVVPLNEELI